MNYEIVNILHALLAGEPISNAEHVSLKDALKPVFFGKGFMTWARNEKRNEIKENIINEGNSLIYRASSDADMLIDSFSSMASELNQGAQLNLFYELYKIFPKFQGEALKVSEIELLKIIKNALHSTVHDVRASSSFLMTETKLLKRIGVF